MELNSLFCHKDNSLLDLIDILNKNAMGAVFVVDDDQKLYGLMTDGDVRRAILNGHELKGKVDSLCNRDPVVVFEGGTEDEWLLKLDDRIRILPVIDREKKVIHYFGGRKNHFYPISVPKLKGKELQYLVDALLSTWISSRGQYILDFEKNFSEFCGMKYGVASSNGTTALHLALLALGIGPGDEVIIPDLTFGATINAVLYVNATPVIVDIDKETWTICPKEVEKAITPKTRAIIPVHLFGQPCDMDAIKRIAVKHQLKIIEDCAQAHGAEFGGKRVGSFGDINAFSFYANKIITTGEGGICLTNDPQLDQKMRILRDHGMNPQKRYWHDVVGYNYRMTNIQAAIGCAQLERIEIILKEREKLERVYDEIFRDNPFIQMQRLDLPNRKKVNWLVAFLVLAGQEDRDALIAYLNQNNVDARPFFFSLSEMPLYAPYRFSNKNSLEISQMGIGLPTDTDLSRHDVKNFFNLIMNFLLKKGKDHYMEQVDHV